MGSTCVIDVTVAVLVARDVVVGGAEDDSEEDLEADDDVAAVLETVDDLDFFPSLALSAAPTKRRRAKSMKSMLGHGEYNIYINDETPFH